MAYDRVPMFIDGGPRHPGAVVRNQTWKATQGATGIGGAGDLRVRATSVPGTTVLIGGGTYVVENKYPSASPQQSYSGRNLNDTAVDIPATTSAGGRNDMIVFRIDDPEYTGTAETTNYATYEFQKPERISNVPAAAIATPNAAAAWLKANRAYPCVALAGIIIPASTGTITNAMIRDLREMANPRRQRSLNVIAINSGSEIQTAMGAAGEQWPNVAGWSVEIPYWATEVRGIATWYGVVAPGGNVNGQLYWRIGSDASGLSKVTAQSSKYDTVDMPGGSRMTVGAADKRPIPADIRGTTQYAHLRGKLDYKASDAARIKIDWASSMTLDLEFLEAPAQDAI